MKDATLHLEAYLPAAGGTVVTGILDLGVDAPGAATGGFPSYTFSDQWRLVRVRVGVPALPNNVNNANAITITFTDSQDNVTFQAGGTGTAAALPLIQAQVFGVANTGSAAAIIDFPLPPQLRGPIQFSLFVPAGNGNNAAGLVTMDVVNE